MLNRTMKGRWLRDSVGEDTLEIDFLECLNVSGSINLLVLPIDDRGDVGRIVSGRHTYDLAAI